MLAVLGLAAFAMVIGNNYGRGQEKQRVERQRYFSRRKTLIGTYRIVGGERNGKKVEAERLRDGTVRIDAKVITTFDKISASSMRLPTNSILPRNLGRSS